MSFQLTVLGSNSAIPSLQRNQSAHVLKIQGRLYLIDCGEGTQLQLKKYHFKIQNIAHIFISHLHGDHYFGLVGLISTMHLMGRTKALHIYAFEELQEIIEIQLNVSQSILSYPLIFHKINKETNECIVEDDKVIVHTVLLKHKVPTTGFIFKEKTPLPNLNKEMIKKLNIPINALNQIKKGKGYNSYDGTYYKHEDLTYANKAPRAYAYCSDTAYNEEIIEDIKDVPLLYHETTFMQNKADAAREKFHSTTIEAATIAKKANVEKLLIGHFSARYDDVNPLLVECKTIFPNTILAEDGLTLDI